VTVTVDAAPAARAGPWTGFARGGERASPEAVDGFARGGERASPEAVDGLRPRSWTRLRRDSPQALTVSRRRRVHRHPA